LRAWRAFPGFRPGKAPVTLIRRRFAEDIQGEVLQSLVPEYIEKALEEKKLIPITRPSVDKVDFKEGEPLRFRAVFEVLPEFELGDYKNLAIHVDAIETGDAQVDKAIEDMRERAATFVPVEGRAAKDGDYVLIKLTGIPVGGGEPLKPTTSCATLAPKRRSRVLRRICAAPAAAKQNNSDRNTPTIIRTRNWQERPTITRWKFRASRKRSCLN
jgi:hypothetical protein